MVTAGRAIGWATRLATTAYDDFVGWRAAIRGRLPLRPGLRTYRLAHPAGGSRRLHLRTHADGSAVLLIDATDAIHFNPTAAMLARLALDGVSPRHAIAALRGRFRGVDADGLQREIERTYALIEQLRTADGCPTCGLDDILHEPLFSVPVAAPYKVDLALTYGCNNACRHCYNRQDHRLRPEDSRLRLRNWRRVLGRLAAVGVPHVIFTGGEPTLLDDLPQLIRAAARLGLVTGLNTNGRRLANRAFVQRLQAAGLDHVQITLESHRREVHNAMSGADAFDETVRGIENALAVGLHALTNTTLTRHNVDHAVETVDFLNRLGLRTFAMNGMIYSGRGGDSGDAVAVESLAAVLAGVRDRAAELRMRFLWYTPTEYCRLSPVELELGARRCNAGEYSMCIEPNGDVLPCQSYYTPVGNILRDPWERIWQSDLFRSFRRRAADPIGCGLPAKCGECPDLPLCGGGCRIEREHEALPVPQALLGV